MKNYNVIGLMSGTSMDGVDLAYVEFTEDNGKWSYILKHADTIDYEEMWRVRLSKLNKQEGTIIAKTNVFYGKYLGHLVADFVEKYHINPDFVSSHGHTLYHAPQEGYTLQIGDGATITANCGLPVISDFRQGDVALGGQGAPLVPVGDKLLFSEYQYCLNLGGIANISGEQHGKTIAYDVCPCNIAFNRIARNQGLLYDTGGEIAASGQVNEDLLNVLNGIDYYKNQGPKSMGREWINNDFWHLTKDFSLSPEDKMCTLVEHVAIQISKSLYEMVDGEEEKLASQKVLVTGGGAFNNYLIDRIKAQTSAQIIIPNEQTINYKEALIFAFLGVLRYRNENNILSSVTGAVSDSCGGAMWGKFGVI